MRPANRVVLSILPAFFVGVGLGHLASKFRSQDQNVSSVHAENARLTAALENAESQKAALQSQLTRIATVDFADYQRLQNEEEQFMKAKEILGKVFLVLFHNLLSDIPKDQMELAQALAAGSTQGSSTSQSSESAAASPAKTPPMASSSSVMPETPAKTDATAGWTLAEKDLGQVNANKPEAFLQAAVIQDIMREQGDARSFSGEDTRLHAMQGHYSGELTFLDPKRKPSTMEMTLMSEVRNGSPYGEFSVRLVDENGRQSRLGGEGNIGEILKPVSPSKALIVRMYKTEFLQMYIFENQGLIVGNYYNEDKSGKVIHLGHFRMQRG